MSVVGRVESVWRYPVKSMRGEALPEIFAGFSGVYGDRIFAFKSSTARAAFPYWTAREAARDGEPNQLAVRGVGDDENQRR